MAAELLPKEKTGLSATASGLVKEKEGLAGSVAPNEKDGAELTGG